MSTRWPWEYCEAYDLQFPHTRGSKSAYMHNINAVMWLELVKQAQQKASDLQKWPLPTDVSALSPIDASVEAGPDSLLFMSTNY